VSTLLTALNHLIGTALAGQSGQGALVVRSLTLDAEGARIIARVDHPLCRGEVVLRLRTESPQSGRQTLRLEVERAPEQFSAALEPFRVLLTSAQLRLDFDAPGAPVSAPTPKD